MNSGSLVYYGGNSYQVTEIVTTSGGDIYAIVTVYPDYKIYKSINNGITWAVAATLDEDTMFPGDGTMYISEVHIAIDSTDIIHIAAGTTHPAATRTIVYGTLDTSTDTLGSWETIITPPVPTHHSACDVVVDANDKPFVFYVYCDNEMSGGDAVGYKNKISGSWSTQEYIGIFDFRKIAVIQAIVIDNDNIEEMEESTHPEVLSYSKVSGTWGSQQVVKTYPGLVLWGNTLTIDKDGSVHHYAMDYLASPNYIYEDGINTNIICGGYAVGCVRSVGNEHYLIYSPSLHDGLYITHGSGTSWSTPMQVTPQTKIESVWLQHNHYNDYEIGKLKFTFATRPNPPAIYYSYYNYIDIGELPPIVGSNGPLAWTT